MYKPVQSSIVHHGQKLEVGATQTVIGGRRNESIVMYAHNGSLFVNASELGQHAAMWMQITSTMCSRNCKTTESRQYGFIDVKFVNRLQDIVTAADEVVKL